LAREPEHSAAEPFVPPPGDGVADDPEDGFADPPVAAGSLAVGSDGAADPAGVDAPPLAVADGVVAAPGLAVETSQAARELATDAARRTARPSRTSCGDGRKDGLPGPRARSRARITRRA
jgi:hypothetical protein